MLYYLFLKIGEIMNIGSLQFYFWLNTAACNGSEEPKELPTKEEKAEAKEAKKEVKEDKESKPEEKKDEKIKEDTKKED